MANKPKLRIVDDANVREVFADTVLFAAGMGGWANIVLGTKRVSRDHINDPSGGINPPKVHTTVRLALTPEATIELANQLNALLSSMRLDRAAQTPDGGPDKGH